ncbi:hypothetical protein A1O7_04947 [Cladophialophora yegresii CBS 114405]|uniref:Uncharacterized protein n=1 Tax=Cladophialophora yegresii CBS 114405 TaxID=1182544 RepID=W9WQZ2_9EURO|nr:uncharacterized protein A1O7_04947 [Cladophialophora yegresii CBS 114405]EXJ60794.1 hypothetical protein A1O7_04947 [Cladophialophora yegresii CBS 114405]
MLKDKYREQWPACFLGSSDFIYLNASMETVFDDLSAFAYLSTPLPPLPSRLTKSSGVTYTIGRRVRGGHGRAGSSKKVDSRSRINKPTQEIEVKKPKVLGLGTGDWVVARTWARTRQVLRDAKRRISGGPISSMDIAARTALYLFQIAWIFPSDQDKFYFSSTSISIEAGKLGVADPVSAIPPSLPPAHGGNPGWPGNRSQNSMYG